MRDLYFDSTASKPMPEEVKEAMVSYINSPHGYANPSSQHRLGDEAAEVLAASREKVAALLNCRPDETVFTSGSTEAINMAVKGVALAYRDRGRHIVASNIEHNRVLRALWRLKKYGYKVTSVGVDKAGMVDPKEVADAIRDDTVLVAVMHANNEIGTIQPIAEISEITSARKVPLLVDATYSAGVVPVDVKEMGANLVAVAAHQFGGPMGAGCLYVAHGTRIVPLLDGGVQEFNRRAGSENMIGIVGMAKAAELALDNMSDRIVYLNDLKHMVVEGIRERVDEIIVNGHPTMSLPNLASVTFKYIEGEGLVILLDDEGICISTRSACAAGGLQASHVLTSIGHDYATAQGTIVFGLDIANTKDDVLKLLDELPNAVQMLRDISPLYRKAQ